MLRSTEMKPNGNTLNKEIELQKVASKTPRQPD